MSYDLAYGLGTPHPFETSINTTASSGVLEAKTITITGLRGSNRADPTLGYMNIIDDVLLPIKADTMYNLAGV